MKLEAQFDDLGDEDPDLLENSGLPKQYVSRLRSALFTRLSDFDGMSDLEMLREPGVSSRIVKAIKAIKDERARPAAKHALRSCLGLSAKED
ncbi:hypothetical protein A6U85_30395 [Agrobacterium sp. 13-626]|nr:hypothetical protein A6U85_30395 [Agrobacterium sp. 13-626]